MNVNRTVRPASFGVLAAALLLLSSSTVEAYVLSPAGTGPGRELCLPNAAISSPPTCDGLACPAAEHPHRILPVRHEGVSLLNRAIPPVVPQILSTAGWGVTSVTVGTYPLTAAYDTGSGDVYVPNSVSDTVSVINGTSVVGTVSVGSGPDFPAYDSGNGYVYVPNVGSDNVSVLNGTALVGTVSVGSEPVSATYDSWNGDIYVPNDLSGSVSVINGTRVVATVTVGTAPYIPVFNAGNGEIYVPDQGSGVGATGGVSVILGTKVVKTLTGLNEPYVPTYDEGNGYVYVPNIGSDSVTVINGTLVIGTVAVGSHPFFAAYDSGDGYVYVSNEVSDNLSVINGTTIVGSVPVGSEPSPASYDSESGDVYVANARSNNVSVVNGLTVVATVPVGSNPISATYDGGNGDIYVSNGGSSFVSVIYPTYSVTFAERGLPAGTGWSVYLAGGPSNSSTNSTISFVIGDGTYPFSVISANATFASAAGAFIVTNAPVLVPVAFTRVTDAVIFSELGLPNGTSWFVILGGMENLSRGRMVEFQEPNGTYPYTIGNVPGWTTARYTGLVVVSGGSVSVSVFWSQVNYTVSFNESGLKPGTEWWINLSSGLSTPSRSSSLAIALPNGSYDYYAAVSDKSFAASSGTISVDGDAVTKMVAFSLITYVLDFTENELPNGTNWSVTIGGSTLHSSRNTIDFMEPNGTYYYSVTPIPGYTTTWSGRATVSGAPRSVGLTFSQVIYALTFVQGGLPAGTNWSVTIGSATLSSTTTSITFMEPNGTYSFIVGSEAGYRGLPGTGSLTVAGPPAAQPITFSSAAPFPTTLLGLPVSEGYALVGGIILVIVGIAGGVLLLRRRRAKTPPSPP